MCGFCSEYFRSDNNSNLFNSMLKNRFKTCSRIIIDSSACYVLPTIGCFVEGYCLIVSKRHVGSIGRLNDVEQDAFAALINLLNEYSLETYNKPVICFEHGAVSCNNLAGGCVDHAHLHVVPYEQKLCDVVRSYGLTVQRIESIRSLHSIAFSDRPYLYWKEINGEEYVVVDEFVSSQFFRKIIADSHGLTDKWDWREYPFVDNMISTYRKAKQFFAECNGKDDEK